MVVVLDFTLKLPHPWKHGYGKGFLFQIPVLLRLLKQRAMEPFYLVYVITQSLRNRSSRPEMFLGKGILKIYSKFTGEHTCRSVISINLLCNFIEIAFRHGCSPVNLRHVFRAPFSENSSGWLLLKEEFLGKVKR